ncbi:D-lactate dehydrogenase [Pedobacter africanus]|uniref:D-lactate dehydrogenase n=1 Tax=Pedobacter africanus TaxID=151894 RepID=A0ACC6KU59_9SPHI|nr:2-hydroxyacid dehydrogenase [Pedobacter africanus]MDR6782779.1 D-lactate dehydrogenase [Pedobacter africanus]
MKAIFYSTKEIEKPLLVKANKKKHEITFVADALNADTACKAAGNDAVVVFTNDEVMAPVIHKLAALGIKYIVTRSVGTDHIDKAAAEQHGIKVSNIPAYSPQAIAEHAVALAMALSRHLVLANHQCHQYNFSLNGLTGFNFYGKTVGLIGLGHIGAATATIFNGLGCKVLGYDVKPQNLDNVKMVSLETLYKVSDIISLHTPLTAETKHIINAAAIRKMKNGVMIINTSRGGLIKTSDALAGLKRKKIGYLGLDVYEFEKGLFFEDHEVDQVRDPLLSELMGHQNVLISPHQAFLTQEALQEIAAQTIKVLNRWARKS